eukprot:283315_1
MEPKSTYERILDTNTFSVAIFGFDDILLSHQFIEVLISSELQHNRQQWIYTINNIEDTIKYYQAAPISFEPRVEKHHRKHPDKGYYIKVNVLNPYLTEEAYNHKSIKYSDTIKTYQYTDVYDFIRNGNLRRFNFDNYLHALHHNNTDIKTDTSNGKEEEDEKYLINNDEICNIDDENINKDKVTLRTKYILEADSFMICYDVRYQTYLNRIRTYLDEIFMLKEYDKLLDEFKQNRMCFFPVTLVGINLDLIKKNTNKITNVQINKLAVEYCVANERKQLFDVGQGDGYWQKRKEMEAFATTVLDYYYYRSLSETQINKRKYITTNSCCLL